MKRLNSCQDGFYSAMWSAFWASISNSAMQLKALTSCPHLISAIHQASWRPAHWGRCRQSPCPCANPWLWSSVGHQIPCGSSPPPLQSLAPQAHGPFLWNIRLWVQQSPVKDAAAHCSPNAIPKGYLVCDPSSRLEQSRATHFRHSGSCMHACAFAT